MSVVGKDGEFFYDRTSGYVPNLKFKDGFLYGLIFGGIIGFVIGSGIIIGLYLLPLLFK